MCLLKRGKSTADVIAVEVVGLGVLGGLVAARDDVAFVVVLEDGNGVLFGAWFATAVEVNKLAVDVVGQARFAV